MYEDETNNVKNMKKLIKQLLDIEQHLTISNCLTLARIVLTPIVCFYMMMQQWHLAWSLFVVAALTDLFDGFLARMLNQQTLLGACLDPIADKFLIISVFFTLACTRATTVSMPSWAVFIVLFKDIFVIVGTGVLYCIQGFIEVRPTLLGKATTFLQMIFIAWIFACYMFHWTPIKTYYCLLGLMLALVIGSFMQYASYGLPMLVRFIRSLLLEDI